MFGFFLARNIIVTTSPIKFIRRCGYNIRHDECAGEELGRMLGRKLLNVLLEC